MSTIIIDEHRPAKAFDTVPHDGLFSKLKHYTYYGIDDKIWLWIYKFPESRKHSVVVYGKQSSPIGVVSSVPKCTGSFMFLPRINALSSVISSKARLFADDY